MRTVTSICFKSIGKDGKECHKIVKYDVANPAHAMRRFFAERGERTDCIPVSIKTVKVVN